MLETLGFSYAWNGQSLDKSTYSEIKQRMFDNDNEIKQRMFDNACEELMVSMNTSTRLQSYGIFKEDAKTEPHLDVIRPKKYKIAFSRLRLSSHPLSLETERFPPIARAD